MLLLSSFSFQITLWSNKLNLCAFASNQKMWNTRPEHWRNMSAVGGFIMINATTTYNHHGEAMLSSWPVWLWKWLFVTIPVVVTVFRRNSDCSPTPSPSPLAIPAAAEKPPFPSTGVTDNSCLSCWADNPQNNLLLSVAFGKSDSFSSLSFLCGRLSPAAHLSVQKWSSITEEWPTGVHGKGTLKSVCENRESSQARIKGRIKH